MAGAFGEPLAGDLARRFGRIALARQTGWTLDIIDGLPLRDWLDFAAVSAALDDLAAFRRGSL